MSTRPSNQLLLMVAVSWAGLLAASSVHLTVLRIAFAVPAVLVLPGVLVLWLVKLRAVPLERWTLTVAISLGLLTGSVLLAALTSRGMSTTSTLAVLAGSTALLCAGCVVAPALRRRSPMSAPLTDPPTAPIPGVAPRAGGPSGRRLVAVWGAAGLVIAAALGTAGWLSVTSAQSVSQPDFTQLSMLAEGKPRTYRLEISNLEGSETRYQLEISRPASRDTLEMVTVPAGQTYHRDVVAGAPGEVVARLYGGSLTDSGYRQVKAVVG